MSESAQRAHFEGDIWDVPLSAWEHTRVKALVEAIPDGVRTILDVGCGDGRITHPLAEAGYEITGVDGSPKALARVRVPKKLGDVTELDFPDASFDLVLCSEVLEHLPGPVHAKTLAELRRVSRQWVLITVPNDEPLQLAHTQCPRCAHVFHIYGHLRSYTEADVRALLPHARRVEAKVRHSAPVWSPWLQRLRFERLHRYQYAPNAVCPECGNADFDALRRDLVRAGLVRLNRRLSRGRTRPGGFLLGLFETG